MIVADTDVLIDFLAGSDPGADLVATHLEQGSLWTTVISQFELLAGVRNKKQLNTIRQLLRALPTLALEAGAAEVAAEIGRDLGSRGEQIAMPDSLIAGIVVHQGATLLTRNEKHFARVKDLRLEK